MPSLADKGPTQAAALFAIGRWDESSWANATPASRGTATTGAPRIAIVDDDRGMRVSLERLLKSAGFRTETFASAEQYLDRSVDEGAGCVILDIGLPGMSGLELGRLLLTCQDPVPVVFISAHDEPQVQREAAQTGAVAFLGKPFDDDALLAVLESLGLTGGEP